jgi:FkbM family methyltransferase
MVWQPKHTFETMSDVYVHPPFLELIDISEIDTIVEMGAECSPSWAVLNEVYSPIEIYSVEANPNFKDFLEEYLEEYLLRFDNVDFTPIALANKNGKIEFYLHSGCASSSSIYEPLKGEGEMIEIDCITLDKFCENKKISKIDLICADVEGAESEIFTNQEIMRTVKYIISEVKLTASFKGHDFPGLPQLTSALEPYGFEMVSLKPTADFMFGDSLWKNPKNIGVSKNE